MRSLAVEDIGVVADCNIRLPFRVDCLLEGFLTGLQDDGLPQTLDLVLQLIILDPQYLEFAIKTHLLLQHLIQPLLLDRLVDL